MASGVPDLVINVGGIAPELYERGIHSVVRRPGSVHDGAAGEVDLARGDGAGPVGRGEDGNVGDLVVAGQMPDQQARGAGCARGAGRAGVRLAVGSFAG